MRYSEKAGYAAIAEVLSEPLTCVDGVEHVVEDVCEAVADYGCGISLPGCLAEYIQFIRQHRI